METHNSSDEGASSSKISPESTNIIGGVKKTRRKRNKPRYTHFKSGSRGGPPRRSKQNQVEGGTPGLGTNNDALQSSDLIFPPNDDALQSSDLNFPPSSTLNEVREDLQGTREQFVATGRQAIPDVLSSTPTNKVDCEAQGQDESEDTRKRAVEVLSSSLDSTSISINKTVCQSQINECEGTEKYSVAVEVPTLPLTSALDSISVDSNEADSQSQEGDDTQQRREQSVSTEVHVSRPHDSASVTSIDTASVPQEASTDFIKPEPLLIEGTLAELQRRIHFPWILVPEDDGINVLLLARDRERSVQRRAFFYFDGREEVSVHRKILCDSIMRDILLNDVNSANISLTQSGKNLFIGRVVTVVRRLRSFEVCVGVDDTKFKQLWEIEKNGEIDKNPYGEARYIETFRPPKCELLVPTLKYTKRRCHACIQARMRLSAKLPHHLSSEAPRNTPNVHLDRQQLIAKCEKQQKDLNYARSQIAKLKDQIKTAIDKDGVNVDGELSDDLCSIIDNANLNPVQALFFEQQLRAINAKDARGRRWHPTLIRFALLLKTTSNAAYKAVQDSGLITLPSERTLYEYSHAISPQAGCNKDKLKRVTKQILKKYPETYQTYHVLLMDEMHVNKKLVYLKSTGEMVGYINVSDAENELKELEAELKGEKVPDNPPMATKVLAFMVKGVATSVKEIVGSYATNDSFDFEQLYDRTWEVIGALERSGIRVIAIVSDGAAVNRAFYNCHVPLTKTTSGVIFDTVNLCAPSRPLFFFSDVPHLLKTIRNCFQKSGSGPSFSRLLTKNGQVIVWQTIKKLYEEDKGNTLRRCYKLNANNVYLNSYSIMKVNLAAQVMSKTVSLDIQSRNWPGTSETVTFIRKVNDFFDKLNGASSKQGQRNANPNLDPYKDVNDKRFDALLDFLSYLNAWKDEVEAKPRFSKKEKSKMVLSQQTLDGIEMTIRAFIGATKHLLNDDVRFINARVFCQDPLERYFSKQRQSGGGSRNPTAAKFYENEVKIGVHGDMNVQNSNVSAEVRGMEVCDEPLPKRARLR